MAALIGGDVDYIKVAGVPAVRAIAQGTPLVIAGGFQQSLGLGDGEGLG